MWDFTCFGVAFILLGVGSVMAPSGLAAGDSTLYTSTLPPNSIKMLTQREQSILDIMHAHIKNAAWQKGGMQRACFSWPSCLDSRLTFWK